MGSTGMQQIHRNPGNSNTSSQYHSVTHQPRRNVSATAPGVLFLLRHKCHPSSSTYFNWWAFPFPNSSASLFKCIMYVGFFRTSLAVLLYKFWSPMRYPGSRRSGQMWSHAFGYKRLSGSSPKHICACAVEQGLIMGNTMSVPFPRTS